MYFCSREQVRKACQILDNYLRVHASERLALPYEKVCSQTDQEEFKSDLYQHIAEEVLLHENLDISSYPIEVPTDKQDLDGLPVKCRVLYPFLEQYIEEQWKLSLKDIRLDRVIPSNDGLQYLEVYSTDEIKPYSKIYRLYDAELKSSMYCYVSLSMEHLRHKDAFRDGMGGAADPSCLPEVLIDRITDGQPYSVEKFMGRGFFVDVSRSEFITMDKLENLLQSNSLDCRQIIWEHHDLNRILNLADQVLPLFSRYYPVETFDDERASTRQQLTKAISHKIRQEKYSIEVEDHKYTLKNDKETISWEGYKSDGTLQFLPNTIKVNDEEVDLSNWLNQISYEETKDIPSDLEVLTSWIEKINELNLSRFFGNEYDTPCEIKYTLEQQENNYKFSFSHCTTSGTRISVEMDGKLDKKQGNGRVDVKIPGDRAMPDRIHWTALTKFCEDNQFTLAQQGFHTEKIKFQINEAYLQEYHRLLSLSSASESANSSTKESTTRRKRPKKSLEL